MNRNHAVTPPLARLALPLALLGLTFSPPAHAATPPLQFTKPITLPAPAADADAKPAAEDLVAVPLDEEVYGEAADGFADLRVLADGKTETSFVLRKGMTDGRSKVRETWTPRNPFTVRLADDGKIEIDWQLADDEGIPQGLRLVTPLSDFEHRVEVLTSADGDAWTPLVSGGLIFDYSRFIDVRNDRLDLPATTNRRFRIVVDDVTAEQQSQLLELTRKLRGGEETERDEREVVNRRPFRIDRIELWRDRPVVSEQIVPYAVTEQVVEEDAKRKQTIVNFEMERQPISALVFAADDRNFSRLVRLEVDVPSEDDSSDSHWRLLAAVGVSRLSFRDLNHEDLEFTFPETRARRFRLAIENSDSRPLNSPKVEPRGPVYEAIFLAEPGVKYSLAYGNAEAAAGEYDVAAIRASLDRGFTPVAATLGSQAETGAPPPPGQSALAALLASSWFQIAAIALLAAALAYALYQASSRVTDLPRE